MRAAAFVDRHGISKTTVSIVLFHLTKFVFGQRVIYGLFKIYFAWGTKTFRAASISQLAYVAGMPPSTLKNIMKGNSKNTGIVTMP